MRTFYLRPASRPAARRAPWPFSLDAIVIVLLLSTLFAGAILAALQPRAPIDAVQASAQGGL